MRGVVRGEGEMVAVIVGWIGCVTFETDTVMREVGVI
jgi:hypothetical protein